MAARIASAPGKLIVSGEYAVVDGAPAIVTAVDCRARVTLHDARSWSFTALPLGIEALAFEFDTGKLVWSDPQASQYLGVVTKVLERLAAGLQPKSITIDTRDFFCSDNQKYGLGSSAAVAVALCGALGVDGADPASFATIKAIHADAQAGVGSGVDIAASLYGGTLEFTTTDGAAAMTWPQELFVRAIFVGKSVQTAPMVSAVMHMVAGQTAARQAFEALRQSAEQCAASWRSRDVQAILRATGHFAAALDTLGKATHVDIVSVAHRQAEKLVGLSGGVYKPSGAGGGDLGIALFDSLGAARDLEARIDSGLSLVPITADATGLRVEDS